MARGALVMLVIIVLLVLALRWAVRRWRAARAAKGPWKLNESYAKDGSGCTLHAHLYRPYTDDSWVKLDWVPREPREDYDARLYEARAKARLDIRLMNDKKGFHS